MMKFLYFEPLTNETETAREEKKIPGDFTVVDVDKVEGTFPKQALQASAWINENIFNKYDDENDTDSEDDDDKPNLIPCKMDVFAKLMHYSEYYTQNPRTPIQTPLKKFSYGPVDSELSANFNKFDTEFEFTVEELFEMWVCATRMFFTNEVQDLLCAKIAFKVLRLGSISDIQHELGLSPNESKQETEIINKMPFPCVLHGREYSRAQKFIADAVGSHHKTWLPPKYKDD